MVAASYALVSQVMTSYPGELLHMDTVGPARVQLVSGKWYVLVILDDFSRFSWVFFLEFKDEAFIFVQDLVLKLRNESHVGPARVQLVSGKWYVLVILDDFSRFSWVFFLEFKDEAFIFVQHLVLKLRNESQ